MRLSLYTLKNATRYCQRYLSNNHYQNKLSTRNIIDFASDVRTLPTESMRKAMYYANVGDDQIGEDPTTNLLQDKMAKMLKKESALFVPSGVMGNLIASIVHCNEIQSEMIVGHLSHIHLSEAGNTSAFGGIHSNVLQNNIDGTLNLNDIRNAIRIDDPHFPKTKLLCLENTHNRCGGTVLTKKYMNDAIDIIKQYNDISIHLDGSRLFNASIKLKCDISELVENIDSVNICFSKNLGAPCGSILIGNDIFINKCKRIRKALGGAMRQNGVLASCCLVSLDEILPKLENDHVNATYVYNEIYDLNINGLKLKTPETNILMYEIDNDNGFPLNDGEYMSYMKDKWDIRIHRWKENVYRFIFHHQNKPENIEILLNSFKNLKKLNYKTSN